MTNTKDKTLLASLSFSDKDKKDPRHDLAGQYIRQPEVAKRIVSLLENCTYTGDVQVSLEIPVTKGEGKYKTFIGFVDGVIFWNRSSRHSNCFLDEVCFETKINPESSGNILRQMRLYSEFGANCKILVTDYDLSSADHDMLKEEGIICVRLGEGFEEFVRAQKETKKDNSRIMSI